MYFTEEEFKIMIDELIYDENSRTDMLCQIAEKTLFKTVENWCKVPLLKGRQYEGDLMQRIEMRLMQKTVTGFVLKDGPNGEINYNPKGFQSWMFTVAKYIYRDFCAEVRRNDYHTTNIDEIGEVADESDNAEEVHERLEKLRWAFNVAISLDSSIYITLTWIAQMMFVLTLDIKRLEANRKLEEMFTNMTLFEMYQMIKNLSENIEWLEIDKNQDDRLMALLNKPWNEEMVYGDVKYGHFFMKKGGLNSISDWINRINERVKRVIKSESSYD